MGYRELGAVRGVDPHVFGAHLWRCAVRAADHDEVAGLLASEN